MIAILSLNNSSDLYMEVKHIEQSVFVFYSNEVAEKNRISSLRIAEYHKLNIKLMHFH